MSSKRLKKNSNLSHKSDKSTDDIQNSSKLTSDRHVTADSAVELDDVQGIAHRVIRFVLQVVLTYLVITFLMRFGTLWAANESQHAFESFAKQVAESEEMSNLNPALDLFAGRQAMSAAMGAAMIVFAIPAWHAVGRAFDWLVRFFQNRAESRPVESDDDAVNRTANRRTSRRVTKRKKNAGHINDSSSELVESTDDKDDVVESTDNTGSTRA